MVAKTTNSFAEKKKCKTICSFIYCHGAKNGFKNFSKMAYNGHQYGVEIGQKCVQIHWTMR